MQLQHLSLTDFRNYAHAELAFPPGLTAIVGANGQGKTNLLEAVAYLASLGSFRGAPPEALVRAGTDQAVVRADALREDRKLLVEVEISPRGRSRAQVNRQPLRRARDLVGALRVSIFSPDDLALVKGGPAGRRGVLDDALVAVDPRNDVLRTDLDRVLRQRNALLKQTGGRLSAEAELTLDVWDQKLADVGERLGAARLRLVGELEPELQRAYAELSGACNAVRARYVSSWQEDGLAAALAASRTDDVRRGVTLVGPHRDELELALAGLPARTHASQGEQRSLALALRVAVHRLVAGAAGSPPILLLDDVFSELDHARSDALLRHLPAGQTLLTTAVGVPSGAEPELVLRVEDGRVDPAC